MFYCRAMISIKIKSKNYKLRFSKKTRCPEGSEMELGSGQYDLIWKGQVLGEEGGVFKI